MGLRNRLLCLELMNDQRLWVCWTTLGHNVSVTLCESPNFHLQVFPLLITVTEEGAKEAGVEVVEHHAQQILVELEGVGELLHHLGNGR